MPEAKFYRDGDCPPLEWASTMARAAAFADNEKRTKTKIRDEAIRESYFAGDSQEAIAKATGLTRQRIQQICGKDEGR